MKFFLTIGDSGYGDLERLAKSYAKERGFKVRDVAKVRLVHQSWGVALQVYNHEDLCIASAAL